MIHQSQKDERNSTMMARNHKHHRDDVSKRQGDLEGGSGVSVSVGLSRGKYNFDPVPYSGRPTIVGGKWGRVNLYDMYQTLCT